MVGVIDAIRNANAISLVVAMIVSYVLAIIGLPFGYLVLRQLLGTLPGRRRARAVILNVYLALALAVFVTVGLIFGIAGIGAHHHRLAFSIACSSLVSFITASTVRKLYP